MLIILLEDHSVLDEFFVLLDWIFQHRDIAKIACQSCHAQAI